MTDLAQQWGGDIEIGPTGDLRVASPDEVVTQRILRRLLTNQGGYIWHLSFGAGLGQFVGQPTDSRTIQAIVGAQLSQEPAVEQDPSPEIQVAPVGPEGAGTLNVQIRYLNALTGQKQAVNFPVRL